jgi:hypothetical protein
MGIRSGSGTTLLALASVLVVLAGCDAVKSGAAEVKQGLGEIKKEFDAGYDESFVKSWKSSFLGASVGGDEERKPLCQCIAEKAVATLSVAELKSADIVTERIFPQCD